MPDLPPEYLALVSVALGALLSGAVTWLAERRREIGQRRENLIRVYGDTLSAALWISDQEGTSEAERGAADKSYRDAMTLLSLLADREMAVAGLEMLEAALKVGRASDAGEYRRRRKEYHWRAGNFTSLARHKIGTQRRGPIYLRRSRRMREQLSGDGDRDRDRDRD